MRQGLVIIITPITIFLGIAYLVNSAYTESGVDIAGVIVSCSIISTSLILLFMALYFQRRDDKTDRTNELLEEILMKLEDKDQYYNNDIDVSINNIKE